MFPYGNKACMETHVHKDQVVIKPILIFAVFLILEIICNIVEP